MELDSYVVWSKCLAKKLSIAKYNVAKMRRIRWMYDKIRIDKLRNDRISETMGVISIKDKVMKITWVV